MGVPGSSRPFRFGVNMTTITDRAEWVAKCRRAEALDYDVVTVADHLGWPAPFPALVAVAEATERVRVGTFVLNSALFNPVLLARDVATTDLLTDGRLELGLGTGYMRHEFEETGILWGSAGARVDHLQRTVDEVSRRLADLEFSPRPAQTAGVPLLVAGNGDRVLRLAATAANIVGFLGSRYAPEVTPPFGPVVLTELAERVQFVRAAAGSRIDDIELNMLVSSFRLATDRLSAAEEFRPYLPEMTSEQLLKESTALIGAPEQVAEQLRELRETLGVSYLTVADRHLDEFAKVIPLLR